MEDRVFIGTSGFSYSDWKKEVYPEDLPKDQWFGFYASHFNFVELNFSFYRQPTVRQMESFAQKAPEGFRYSVKLNRSLTHEPGSDWQEQARIFSEACLPLKEKHMLAPVLVQFPWSFKYTKANRIYLDKLCGSLELLPLAVEFRNSEWISPRVTGALFERNITPVSLDMPALKGLPGHCSFSQGKRQLPVYLRFHGRREDTWWKGTNVSRYDYLYSREELESWVPFLAQEKKKGSILYIAFNNHYKGQAVKNAVDLAKQLTRQISSSAS